MASPTEEDTAFETSRPSEATIEGMANHSLLANLGDNAWVLSPTPHEENEEGFDASLNGTYRKAVIQYKRIARTPDYGVSVEISSEQYQVLRQYPSDTAFYAFSRHESYADVSSSFQANGTSQFLKNLIFVPINTCNDLNGIRTIGFFEEDNGQCKKHLGNRDYDLLEWHVGTDWLEEFKKGGVGTTFGVGEEHEARTYPMGAEGGSGRSLLYAGQS